eukprot:2802145-Amphidinium_carterae.1
MSLRLGSSYSGSAKRSGVRMDSLLADFHFDERAVEHPAQSALGNLNGALGIPQPLSTDPRNREPPQLNMSNVPKSPRTSRDVRTAAFYGLSWTRFRTSSNLEFFVGLMMPLAP